jgi:hypothetical protein
MKKTKRRSAHWNMSRLTKTQIQLLDALGLDMVLLTETWNTAAPLEHYSGPNRMLTSGKPDSRLDPAGAVAVRWRCA